LRAVPLCLAASLRLASPLLGAPARLDLGLSDGDLEGPRAFALAAFAVFFVPTGQIETHGQSFSPG
jgi:hypothetical protein